MATFLLTYNPEKWLWPDEDLQAAISRTEAGFPCPDRWSIGGRTGGIAPGDRVFLLRQGVPPRGIVASGHATSEAFRDPHWDGTPGKLGNYVEVEWDRIVDVDDPVPTEVLKAEIPHTHWATKASGITVKPPGDARLEQLWRAHT